MSVQKVVSTKENKELQKSSTFHSSSTVFWGILSKSEGIDTTVSFLNHFLLKRDITSVSMRLCVRRMNGDLLSEIIEEIKEPRVYSYSLESILSSVEIESGEFSIYIEFTSRGNLSVPFCAVTSEIVSKRFVDIVHTYGRALENQEIGSRIDFDTSYETGWSIWNFGENFSNNAIFHNGRIHSKLSFDLCVLKEADEIFRIEGLSYDLKPFESCRINLEHALAVADKEGKIVGIIEDAAPGDIVVKVIISGLQASFPRLLFAYFSS